MNWKQFEFLSILNFLLNPLKFGVTGDDGGGGSGGNSDDNAGGKKDDDNSGGQKDNKGRDWSDNVGKKSDDDGSKGKTDDKGGKDDGKVDLSTLPEGVQKYIKDLRKENANYRTQSRNNEDKLDKITNGLKSIFGEDDGDQVSPEEQVQILSSHNGSLEFRNSVLTIAVENGLNTDQAEYLEFLIAKEAESLKDNEELSEDVYEELLGKVKGLGGASGGSKTDTSADGDGTPPAGEGGKGETTVEDFARMSLVQKTKLKNENPNLYNKLFADARKKRML